MEIAVVIGGSGGIGNEIIKMLLINKVSIINIDRIKGKIEDSNLNTIICDLKQENVYDIVQKVCGNISNVNYFISTIGYYEARSIENITKQYLMEMLDSNLIFPTIFAQEIYKKMKIQDNGKIVIILSTAAYIGSRDLAYSISKAGELGLVRGLAKGTKGSKVSIYGIAPGIVKTKMSENMSMDRMNDAILGTSMGRMCEPVEVANLVEYVLFKDKGYMSGSVIHINNGLYLN